MRTILRVCTIALSLLSFYVAGFSQQVAKKIPYPASPDGVIGFLEFRPSDYGSQKHPLIIFLHGVGERGNGTSQIGVVAYNALPLYCANGATMRFTVGGQTSSFVVLSPQLSTQYGFWPPFYVKEMINYAKANLQIDPNRIYVTGLSLGGGGVWRLITDTENFDNTFDSNIAAVAPICGTQEENDNNYCNTVAANHLPIWAFHCMDDVNVSVSATQHAEILSKSCGVSPASKFTYYQAGGHGGAWLNAYDTGHVTRTVSVNGNLSGFTASPNLYEWFLTQTRSTSQTNYTAPVVSAGVAQSISLPLNLVTLTGTGTGTNGATISSYSWTKTSGPAAGVISLPLLNTTLVTGLVQGVYVFTLTATDNHGLSSSSNVTINVNPLFNNQAPVANAGNNINITLPANSITLNGSGSDPDGTIASYSWTKTDGTSSGTIVSPNSAVTSVTGLTEGHYVFVFTVTDNQGLTDSKAVAVTVNAAPAYAYTAPVANPGNAQTITLPSNTVTLSGTSSTGSTISSYSWSKTDGPSSGTVISPNSSVSSVTGLTQGRYVFVLTVTDNTTGLTDSKAVVVTVNAAPAYTYTPPSANPGNAQTVTLPTSTVTLSGAGSTGSAISSYSWSKTDGPSSGTIISPNSTATSVTGLTQGRYVFVLTVTDNTGLTDSKAVVVTVNAATTYAYTAPVANPGNAQTITLPTNTVTLSGAGSTGSTISSYSWSKTDGPSAGAVISPNSSVTSVTGLTQGRYVFVLTVTDNTTGLTDSKAVTISVNAAATVGIPATIAQQPIGYIKMSYGPSQACDDASSAGRIPIYGTGIANGNFVYADAAMTQKYDGGWNWFSFTPVLGGAVTQAFAIYPIGSIGLLTSCAAGARIAVNQQEKTITQQAAISVTPADAAIAVTAGKLSMYPNPAHTTATIELTSAGNNIKTINLYNSNGILKAQYKWQIIKGNNTFPLKNVSGLPNGLYIIDVRDSNGKQDGKLKFIKI